MLIGISIHYTSIIPLIVFLLVVKIADKIKAKYIFILLLVSVLMSIFDFIKVFAILFENTRYSFYFSNQRIPVNFIKIIALNSLSLFILFYFDKIKNAYPYQKYLLVLYFLSVVIINILAPLDDLSRIYTYFRIFEIIVVTDLIFLQTKRIRIFLFSFFYVFYFSTFLIALKKDYDIQNNTKSKFTPYKSIFES